jgi:hypothetical protein
VRQETAAAASATTRKPAFRTRTIGTSQHSMAN